MKKKTVIQMEDETPMTHFFIYKNKKFPIKFDFFKNASNYFLEHQEEIKQTKTIPLVDETSDNYFNFTDETIQNFINYVHQQPISLDNENVVHINYLANKYGIQQLIKATNKYIAENHSEISIQILLIHQNNPNFDTKIYEEAISDNFTDYIKDDRLLDLNFLTLYRILTKYQHNSQKIEKDDFFDFLFKCLDKYGRTASILFENVDFGDNKIEYLNLLITKYSKIFDFHFINCEFLKTIYERQNLVLQKQIENQNNLGLENQSMKDEMKRMKDDYDKKISEMKEVIDKLNESQKQQEEMQKKSEELLLKRLENLEENQKEFQKLIDEKNSMISQYEKQMLEMKSNENIIELNHVEGKEFEGINNYLNKLAGGNCHDSGSIEITSNSCTNSNNYHPKNLIDYQNNSVFQSNNDITNIEICFDFKDKKVQLTSYTIKSNCWSGPNYHHLRNWNIEVSNDRNKWEPADKRNNDSRLNNADAVATFTTYKLNEFYRFVRLRQTGVNWYNYNYVIFNALEFYGKLIIPK